MVISAHEQGPEEDPFEDWSLGRGHGDGTYRTASTSAELWCVRNGPELQQTSSRPASGSLSEGLGLGQVTSVPTPGTNPVATSGTAGATAGT